MAKLGTAIQHRSDAQSDAAAAERVRPVRPVLSAVAGGRSSERTAALTRLRAGGSRLVILAAGLAVWTVVIYGFLSRLTGSFN